MTAGGVDRERAPLVSVVIPAYNCALYVAEAVESALGQTFEPHEVIVVDDGSTDGTRAALAAYETRIRYVHQANQGAAAARNRGLLEARGDLIAFLDADDVWLPEKLEWQVRAMAALPDCGLVYTDGLAIGIRGAPSGTLVSRRARTWIDEHGTAWPHLACGDLTPVLWFENCICSSSSVMVRRRCLDETGGFDPALVIAEDYDVWIKIGLRHPIAMVDRDLFRYRWREGSLLGPASERDLRCREGALAVIERHLAAAPGTLLPLIDRHMARDYWYCARSQFENDRFSEARPMFRGSLRHDPWFLPPVAFLAASLLGRPIVHAARGAWSGVRNLWRRPAA